MQTEEKHKMFIIPIVEVVLSLISLWWGVVLFNNPNLFNDLPEVYRFFGRVTTEYNWGFVFLFSAFVKIIGIILRNAKLRKFGLLMSAIIYGIISSGYYLGSGFYSIGFGVFGLISFMALWGIREVKTRNA